MTILTHLPVGRAEGPDASPGSERGPEPPRRRAPFHLHSRGSSPLTYRADSITTLARYFFWWSGAAIAASLAAACGNETARAPNPTAYDWPDSFAYRMHEVARTERDTEAVARYETSRELRAVVGYDGAYAFSQDSVRNGSGLEGEPLRPLPLLSEDTLRYFVRLSRWGEFLSEEPACDPAVPECRDARPSTLLMSLRRIIPRLPVWWPPKGRSWDDTLPIDDAPRLRGLQGTLTTEYRAPRDTVAGGRACWIVTWRATWRSAHPEVVAGITYGIATETAVAYVDKQQQMPALVIWRGTYPPPPGSLGLGATRTEVRGSAVLVGGVFDSPAFTQEAR